MNRHARPPTGRQRGFALVLALGAIAVVLALAAALDAWVSARIEQARLIRVRVQDELDAYSTRATVLYLLGTQRYTLAGLTTGAQREDSPASDPEEASLRIEPVGGEIALDGTPYRGIGRVRFALQDEGGLVALNAESQDRLRRLLGGGTQVAGVGPDPVEPLLDALADYRDTNTLRRLNGAEQEEYLAAGLPPPPNRNLRSVPELLRVMGWSDWLAEHPDFRLHAWLSAGRSGTFNPNTAPREVLVRAVGIEPDVATRLVAERATDPIANVTEFGSRADVDAELDEDMTRFYPTDFLQLRIWREGAAQADMLALQLTPRHRQAPWQIGSVYRITLGRQDEAHDAPGEYFRTGAPAAR